jgi:endonuclease YncB( thermonuclease family)
MSARSSPRPARRTRAPRVVGTACCGIVVLLLLPAACTAGVPIVGVATVRDGDSIEIHGQTIRLYGIDAPEGRQVCRRDGADWRCGQAAAHALAKHIGRRPVSCRPRDRDRYGRSVAVCFVADEDVGAWLVREGWALAYRRYSRDYVGAEEAARAAKRGLWSATFMPPWEWRAQHETSPAASSEHAPGACRIKGNVTRSGSRLYHLPGDRGYVATRIDPARGERWFCSEAEARAAGWRRSQ